MQFAAQLRQLDPERFERASADDEEVNEAVKQTAAASSRPVEKVKEKKKSKSEAKEKEKPETTKKQKASSFGAALASGLRGSNTDSKPIAMPSSVSVTTPAPSASAHTQQAATSHKASSFGAALAAGLRSDASGVSKPASSSSSSAPSSVSSIAPPSSSRVNDFGLALARQLAANHANPSATLPANNASISTPTPAPSVAQSVRCGEPSCGKEASPASMKKCGRCRVIYYCSPDCQRKHWKAHKLVCHE